MDTVNSTLDFTSWICCFIRNTTYYIRHLQDNLTSLRNEMETLRAKRNNVKIRIEADEGPLMKRTEQIVDWLGRVEELGREVEVLLQHGAEQIQKKCLKICPRNCLSSHKLSKKVCQKLQAVSEMKSEGNSITVVVPLARVHAQEIPLDRTVGLDSNVHKLLRLLRDDDGHGMGIIGIYGMGGVGKTTLLKNLNNKLATDDQWRGKFDEVIWVVVSKDESSVESVQDKMGKKLGFPDTWRSDKSQDEKRQDIFRVLKMKRFVLLLDDIWKRIDLLEVGVPVLFLADNQNKAAKVVFTTRSEEVCGLMEAKKKIKVECLAWQQAWDLFKEKVGEEILNSDPEIEKLAPDVCKECAGLPLALITIGRAMASKRAPQEWNYAINELKKSTFKISGMEDEMLHRLKFSYDSLHDETIKICFLYCALYPEDWDIYVPDLIKFWIGEGFLDDRCDNNIDHAWKLAYEIIGRLKLACLLLGGRESDSIVNMHDVIRDMALWIVSNSGRKKEKYLVQGGNPKLIAPPILKLEKAERVFLLRNSIKELSGTPKCDNLLTLNLRGNYGLRTISNSFFQFMPSLKVLDLSSCKMTFLPASFFELPSLQHLDLSATDITKLPIEFKSLVKLKYLYMNYMRQLDMIPPRVISSLLILQRFEMLGTGGVSSEQVIDEGSILFGGNELLLDELECLNHLQYLSLTVKTELALEKLLSWQKLQSCIFGLTIKLCKGTSQLQLSSLQKNIKRLEIFQINGCDDLEELSIDVMRWDERERAAVPHKYNNPWNIIESIIDGSRSFHNLQKVWISDCKVLKDLTWLISMPNLRELRIWNCDTIKEVIKVADCNSREGSLSVFARLQRLALCELPELKSIYSHPLSFPSLIKIDVANCPKLNKLPFDSNSGKHTLRYILCEREWHNKLEWENEETRSTFFSLFKYKES